MKEHIVSFTKSSPWYTNLLRALKVKGVIGYKIHFYMLFELKCATMLNTAKVYSLMRTASWPFVVMNQESVFKRQQKSV